MTLEAQAAEWDEYTRRAREAGAETVCGPGSTLAFTAPLRAWLPDIIDRYHIHSILDAPCGDWHWIQHTDLRGATYLGWDINTPTTDVPWHGSPEWQFEQVNLLKRRKTPTVDLVICRDFLAHIPDEHVVKVLRKFRNSGSRYLLATNFTGTNTTDPHPTDQNGFYYRPVNLCAPPFDMPTPVNTLAEVGPEPGRYMALFELQ
jgi:hypothetical protein